MLKRHNQFTQKWTSCLRKQFKGITMPGGSTMSIGEEMNTYTDWPECIFR